VTRRPLGGTGLTVSALSLGTASLGANYGIAAPGATARPTTDLAIALIREAVERGITLIDTAPAYGDAERLVGDAVGNDPRVLVATKVAADARAADVATSLTSSLSLLRRDAADVVQIHNATRQTIEQGEVTQVLVEAKDRGLVRVLGASVYGEDAALAAIEAGSFGVIQVAFNVLDQRMARVVFPRAAAAGVGVIVRSAYLKGALTPRAAWLPAPLDPLRAAATRVCDELAAGSWDTLPPTALRFCLSASPVSTVLVGVTTIAELDAALAAEAAGALDPPTLARAAGLAITEDELLNPSRWPAVP
jgi:aryl-alcohol dehydrogenase-like predicted oxidoreductase